MKEIVIKVPASTANLGPGFDSLGLALQLYLTVKFDSEKVTNHWLVKHNMGKEISSDETNLIVSTALSICPTLKARELEVTSDIPLTRGLGSSSSAIVAGLLLANYLGQLNLSQDELALKASEIEGHPDNVIPALLGGLNVCQFSNGKLNFLALPLPTEKFLAYIPDYSLSTAEARKVLPQSYDKPQAIQQSALANVLVAALAQCNWALAGQLLESDSFHEPYRAKLVPEFLEIRQFSKEYAADGCYLSGAGPTVMTMIAEEQAESFAEFLRVKYKAGKVLILSPDAVGAQILLEDY